MSLIVIVRESLDFHQLGDWDDTVLLLRLLCSASLMLVNCQYHTGKQYSTKHGPNNLFDDDAQHNLEINSRMCSTLLIAQSVS